MYEFGASRLGCGMERMTRWEVAGSRAGRKDRDRGHTGVKRIPATDGWTIGPPADREYAVEPVGVVTSNLLGAQS